MPDVDFRYLLLGCLAIALAYAAVTDIKRRQIDNWLNAAIALAAPLYWWASGLQLWPDVAFQIILMLIVFFGLALVFARGGMGGGDVKLLAALALWLPPLVFFSAIFLISLAGGAMSMVAGARNLSLDEDQSAKRRLALAGTGLWVAGSAYVGWVMNGGTALDLSAWLPSLAVTAAVLAMFGITVAGALVVSRNQKSRLPVPYGVAISTGGLLVLFTQVFPTARTAFAGAGIG